MGILDFFQQTNSPYPEDMRYKAGMQSLGLLGGTMMAAGAPSTDPGQYGRIMAQGLAQAGPMMQQSLDQQMQMQDMMAEREREAAMQEYIAGGAGGLLSPEQIAVAQNLPPEVIGGMLGEQMFAGAGDPFTLGAGEIRFDANGNPIAQGPEDTPDPTSSMREYEFAVSQGYQGSYLDFERDLAEAASTRIINEAPLPALAGTPGFVEVDKTFASDVFVPMMMAGGFADAEKGMEQLSVVVDRLDSVVSGESDADLSGTLVSLSSLLGNTVESALNPEAVDTRQLVEEVVQRNLRLILGAQFTEKEGTRLIERAYNPALSERQNAERLRRLLTSMQDAYNAKVGAAQYFAENSTLYGYAGNPQFMSNAGTLAILENALGPDEVAGNANNDDTLSGVRIKYDSDGNRIQ